MTTKHAISKNNASTTPGLSLLVYMTLMILLITLAPFRFQLPESITFIWSSSAKNLILNVLFFVPFGFLFRLSEKSPSRFCIKPFAYGVVLSLFIEFTQAFIIGRTTSGVDLVANGSGALIGAGILDYVRGKIDEKEPYRVSTLQIPLVNLVLLLTPLIWLTCISSGNNPLRLYLLLLPLGVFGTGLLSSVFVNRLAYTGTSPNRFISTATVWFVLSTLPAMVRFPKDVAVIWIVMVVAILVFALAQKPMATKQNRRFELPTLKRVVPFLGAYLILLLLLPSDMGVSKIPQQVKLMATIRLVELIAAFAVLGYVVAEMRGRKQDKPATVLALTAAVTIAFLLFTSLIKGSFPTTFKELFYILPLVLGSLYGCILYRTQLAVFRRK